MRLWQRLSSPPFWGRALAWLSILGCLVADPGMLEGDEPAAGKFLIASRGLLDPNFSQTVILLVEYGSEGAMGVIINRPTAVDLEELLPDLGGDEAPDVTVGVGGPVAHWQMVLLYRRSAGFEESESVFDDVYFSASRDVLDQLLAEGSEFRIYVGYAGWSPGQLDFEIDRGSWYVLPGDTDSIFGPAPFELWRELIVQGEAKWVLTPAPPSVPGARQDPALARVSPVDRRVPAVE